jgi:hypothetical protein
VKYQSQALNASISRERTRDSGKSGSAVEHIFCRLIVVADFEMFSGAKTLLALISSSDSLISRTLFPPSRGVWRRKNWLSGGAMFVKIHLYRK